jgi:hypothetical protein
MMFPGWSQILTPKSYTNDETLQNFIYKHTVDLENVQRNKKKDKETSSKLKLDVQVSLCQKLSACTRSAIFLHVKNQPLAIGQP